MIRANKRCWRGRFTDREMAQAGCWPVSAGALPGATLPRRDPVDVRIVEEVRSGTVTYTEGKGIITDIKQVGGYPEYKGVPYKDTDGDGMPDEWEIKHELNPNDASDAAKDANGDGYTNIEKYLNGLEPSKARGGE